MSTSTFEPALLPTAEKERLVRELLDEFRLEVHSHSAHRQELIIPCVLGEHRNQDREPTAAVNYEKLTFKCLGCQRSGGLLWFIAEHRGVDTKEAREWLAKETGTDGQIQDLPTLLRYFDALYKDRPGREPIPTYSQKILEPWALIHPWVTDPIEIDEQGRNVGGRGVPEENVLRFQVGYAERYRYSRDTYSERIVLPHFWQGNLVGWQTRRLAADGTAKYKSSTDFPKDSTVYNYDPGAKEAMVVESPFSVIRHEAEDLHWEATFGANVTERQITLLTRHERIFWWLDNDPAGWTAYLGLFDDRGNQTKAGVLEECARSTDVWVVENPYNADPADLDEVTVRALKASAVPWVVWSIPERLICHRCGGQAHAGGC